VHLNCALWSDDVYERVNGALMNVDNALQQGQSTKCALCGHVGATIHCFKVRCSNVYHLSCAVKDECVFFKNKVIFVLLTSRIIASNAQAGVRQEKEDDRLEVKKIRFFIFYNGLFFAFSYWP